MFAVLYALAFLSVEYDAVRVAMYDGVGIRHQARADVRQEATAGRGGAEHPEGKISVVILVLRGCMHPFVILELIVPFEGRLLSFRR